MKRFSSRVCAVLVGLTLPSADFVVNHAEAANGAPPAPVALQAPATAATPLQPATAVPAAAAAPAAAPTAASTTSEKTADSEAAKKEQEEAKKKAEEQKRKAEEAQKKQQRQQKIQQLQFDRRPSAILKAWSDEAEEHATARRNSRSSGEGLPPGRPPKPEPDTFDHKINIFRRNVTLSRWDAVEKFLADMEEDEAKALYARMLQSLQGAPPGVPTDLPPQVQNQLRQLQQMQRQQQGGQPEKNVFSFEDVVALAGCAPTKLEKRTLASLGAIARMALDGGNVVEEFSQRLREETAKPEDDAVLTRRQAAQLLFAAGQSLPAGEFLPEVGQAEKEDDFEALNLLSRYYMALHAEEKKIEHLEQAWKVTQAVLAAEVLKKEEKDQALRRAVELAPKLHEQLGNAWLEESFTGRPERGMEIIATIGTSASQALQRQARMAPQRLKGLQLQTTAVEALLKASPERAAEWKDKLTVLATNWLREATIAHQYDQSTRRGPMLQRDIYGNYFYNDRNPYSRSSGRVQSIKTADLLEIRPSDAWLALVDHSLKPKFDMTFARLLLKVNEEDEAFPYIEQLATAYPELAEDLVDEFLRVWTNNHDPNANRNRTNYYMFMYGYERKAESIPLTRSKQERNLKELAELVRRLRALPLEELNEQLLARAFTTCHSSAEVYRLAAIEEVFGSLDDLEPKTLAELAQQMRANLVGVWRQPAVQKDKKTRRKQKDIQAEVLRGYRVASSVIEGGLQKHPDHWALQLAKASIEHDENNYRREIAPDSEFTERRDDAFAEFRKAVDLYTAQLDEIEEDDETTRAYELWYYASLGACDLGGITEEMVPDLRQPAQIRDAMLALPGEAAERHLAKFANTLFTRMSSVKPAIKFRYVRTGLEIVGDHKQAAEARKVYEYYNDLVTEIELEAKVDGSDVVGHTQPFGVFVNLRHTREIERESGGFGRYLQNQNAGRSYYYNYGRPLENYRDKFEEIVHQALDEHFDVLSVTFQSEDVNSKALPEYGWRVTPYAYMLVQAKGPEIDKLPPVRLDLDFLDTSGYAILPVETPAVPIDASSEAGGPRPLQKLTITQTLDERQADEGKLILEVKASAQGLVPELDDLLDVAPQGFDVVETEDEGISVSRFDPDSDETLIVSERTWMITLNAQEDLPQRPASFQFPESKLDVHEVTYQRYNDADLLAVDREISLEEEYGETSYAGLWILGGVAAVVIAGSLALLWMAARRKPQLAEEGVRLPEKLTPFTVLGLLRRIEESNGFGEAGRMELRTSIERLERYYFVEGEDEEPDLARIANMWAHRATNGGRVAARV